MTDTDGPLRALIRLDANVQRLRECAELVLLFHSGGEWSAEKRNRWYCVTGNEDATTKVLCDHLRMVLAETKP